MQRLSRSHAQLPKDSRGEGPEALQQGRVREQGSPGESREGGRRRGAPKRGVHLTSTWKAPTIVSCVTWSCHTCHTWSCPTPIRLAGQGSWGQKRKNKQGAWAWPVWAVSSPHDFCWATRRLHRFLPGTPCLLLRILARTRQSAPVRAWSLPQAAYRLPPLSHVPLDLLEVQAAGRCLS